MRILIKFILWRLYLNSSFECFLGAQSNKIDGQIGSDKKPEYEIQYLLQVWRKSDGNMIYERKLKNPPKGWGLYLHKEEDQSFDHAMNMFFY